MFIEIIISILFIYSCSNSFAQSKPDWVDNNGISAQYPTNLYITGFDIGENESLAERKQIAVQRARAELSSKFIVKIRNELIIKEIETSGKYYSDFINTVNSQTQLKSINLGIENYDDDRHNLHYALVFMEIKTSIKNYTDDLNNLNTQIQSLITNAEEYEQNGQKDLAVKTYRKTFPLFLELGETSTILRILQNKSPFPLSDESQQIFIPYTRTDIEAKISRIFDEKNILTIEECAVSIAGKLHQQYESSKHIAVYPFTYHDRDFSSQFSNVFLHILENELIDYFSIVSPDFSAQNLSQNHDVLNGVYWEEGDNVRIIAYITDLQTGRKKASDSIKVPLEIFKKEGVEINPPNFQQVMEDDKVFLNQDVIPGTLSLEVWTSNGDKYLIFKENEKTELLFRVNKPCYLQVIYHLANSYRLLLDNNHYIDVSKVNRVYTYPRKFYFVTPLGIERLQVFASTEEFDDVRITSATFDSVTYDNVFAEDFEKHTIAMRGIKKVEPERELAEKILTITTIPK